MKKIITFLTVFVMALVLVVFTGCKKPQGTFYVDNSTDYGVDVSWNGYSMYAGPYASKEWTVNTGSGYATVYVEGYGYLDDDYVSIDSGGTDGVSVYYTKAAETPKNPKGIKVVLKSKKGK